jgi:hypothetical protein
MQGISQMGPKQANRKSQTLARNEIIKPCMRKVNWNENLIDFHQEFNKTTRIR